MISFPEKLGEWKRQAMQSDVVGEATQKCTGKCKGKLYPAAVTSEMTLL